MATGLPIVASDTPPIHEILGSCGFTIENNPEYFRTTFDKIIQDNRLRKSLGTKARLKAENISGEKMEEKEIEVYKSIMFEIDNKK